MAVTTAVTVRGEYVGCAAYRAGPFLGSPTCGPGFSLHLKTLQNSAASLRSPQLHNPTPNTVLAPLASHASSWVVCLLPPPSTRLTLLFSMPYNADAGKPPLLLVFPDDPLLLCQSNISKWRLHLLTLSIYHRKCKIENKSRPYFFHAVYSFPQTSAVTLITLPLSILSCPFPLPLHYG